MTKAKEPVGEKLNKKQRSELADEFEKVRAAGLRIADAARAFSVRTEDLEWALWATDGKQRARFNQDYADEQLAKRAPEWRAALDDLRHALEQDSTAVMSR